MRGSAWGLPRTRLLGTNRVNKGREGYVARNPCLSVMLVEADSVG
jgi:hypothetical protein